MSSHKESTKAGDVLIITKSSPLKGKVVCCHLTLCRMDECEMETYFGCPADPEVAEMHIGREASFCIETHTRSKDDLGGSC